MTTQSEHQGGCLAHPARASLGQKQGRGDLANMRRARREDARPHAEWGLSRYLAADPHAGTLVEVWVENRGR